MDGHLASYPYTARLPQGRQRAHRHVLACHRATCRPVVARTAASASHSLLLGLVAAARSAAPPNETAMGPPFLAGALHQDFGKGDSCRQRKSARRVAHRRAAQVANFAFPESPEMSPSPLPRVAMGKNRVVHSAVHRLIRPGKRPEWPPPMQNAHCCIAANTNKLPP